jgi:acetyltransferase-like isoleucine patch superfamily enzyme/glycosyltransferase involved in cell wall biosynthesis
MGGPGRTPVAVLIPTKNEEVNLPFALASVKEWAAEVFVLDSGSTDRTRQIAEEHGATFVHHPWEGYALQKNWGLDNLPITARWVFILDADETITPELAREVQEIARRDDAPEDAFYVNRFLIFLGKRIRHSGYYPSWNVRFFRRGKARYEERSVHEHMIVEGPTGYLDGHMEHHDRRGLDHFIAKHNLYSSLEAAELFRIQQDLASGTIKFRFWGGPIERRRWIKHKVWPKVPARSFARWFYMYVLQLGFLDGRAGFHLCKLLADYEHQITLKLAEMRKAGGVTRSVQAVAQIADTYPAPKHLAPASEPDNGTPAPAHPTGSAGPVVDEHMKERFNESERWPYPKHIYVARLLWAIVWSTLWKVCWWRLPIFRKLLLRLFGAKIGSVGLSGSTWIEMPWDLRIGKGVIIGPRATLYNLGGLTIGDHTVISQDAYICGGTHDHTDPTYPLIRKRITIGSYVWIAAGAFIHPGVTIGEGAVVGARAVVTRDVEPWTIVAGNPAVFVKRRVMRRAPVQGPGEPQPQPVELQTTP